MRLNPTEEGEAGMRYRAGAWRPRASHSLDAGRAAKAPGSLGAGPGTAMWELMASDGWPDLTELQSQNKRASRGSSRSGKAPSGPGTWEILADCSVKLLQCTI